MDYALEDIFLRADYRVRLACGGSVTIRIGEPLPAALRELLPANDACWGFITAWNPRGTPRSRASNRFAQRELRDALSRVAPGATVRAGYGALDDWREASLFVAGIDFARLDRLMQKFGQLAFLRGCGGGLARLRWAL